MKGPEMHSTSTTAWEEVAPQKTKNQKKNTNKNSKKKLIINIALLYLMPGSSYFGYRHSNLMNYGLSVVPVTESKQKNLTNIDYSSSIEC